MARRCISRRDVLACIALAAACRFRPEQAEAQPAFSPAGPDALRYGAADGYPVPGFLRSRLHGNPFEPGYRVGAFSHFDEMYETRLIARSDTPWPFKRQAKTLVYSHGGRASSIDDYLNRNPVTGLLIAQDDRILCERYQYGRSDRDRMLSQSMVKSIVGLLAGIAAGEGAIRSVDDRVDAYVPGFAGTEYGSTPIRALLHMASGVDFGEERDGGRDLDRLWRDMVAGPLFGLGRPKGTVASLARFDHRVAPPGTRFQYASIEPDVVSTVVRAAVGRSISAYLREKIWQPIGAEADARWLLDAEGNEVGHFGFGAVLRDYARLGRLMAWDGAWGDRQVIPAQWMIDATTVRPDDSFLAPDRAMPGFGYGYFLWLLPGPRRQFALVGANGQRLCIDPATRLVMVQTGLEDFPEVWNLWAAVVRQFGQG